MSQYKKIPQHSAVLYAMWLARWFLTLSVALFALAEPLWRDFFRLPARPMWLIFAFLLAVNVAVWFFRRQRISDLFLLECTLLADVIALAEIMVFSGGTNNPLIFLFLIPVLVAALVCPPRFAWSLTFLTSLIYFVLFFVHLPMPIVSRYADSLLRIHLMGMWLTFLLSAVIITGGVSWLVQSLRDREYRLKIAHQKQQENEYWLKLGLEAANTAHQLSTPLNNLILLSAEMQSAREHDEDEKKDWATLDRQLQTCKTILQKLKHSAASGLRPVWLYGALDEQLAQWHNLRPDARCPVHRDDAGDVYVWLDDAFWGAFLNILNNAADAGGGEVELHSRILPDDTWELGIHNRHGCLSQDQLRDAGFDIESEKPAGLGLGVRLSHATLSRLSGSLTLSNHPKGGVYAEIRLPLRRAENPRNL